MAGVTVDSGEFLLMRNVDVEHQPSRAKVYNAWSKAFGLYGNVPDAVDHLADIIEDVYTFELWKDNFLDTPEELFDRMGILGLDLEEPAKLIKALRSKKSTKKQEIIARAEKAKELREEGKTQQQIADELGVSRRTVNSDISAENTVQTPKPAQEKRKVIQYTITQYTTPETAANKIRDKFGDEFADQLKELL